MTYSIDGFLKYCEEDDYEEGCLPNTLQTDFITGVSFTAETIEEMLEKVRIFFNVKEDAVELDACEEVGRIDVSKMEDARGDSPTIDQLAMWKRGRLTLWYVTYSGMLVSQSPASWKG